MQRDIAELDETEDKGSEATRIDPVSHTAYLVNHASDLTKLIKFIILSKEVDNDSLRQVMISVH